MPVLDLRVGDKGFVSSEVPSLVLTRVNIAARRDALDDLRNRAFVPCIGGADEIVVGDVENSPQVVVVGHYAVGELDRLDALGVGRLFDLLTVLVGSGEKSHLGAGEPMVARKDIGHDRRIDVPNVGHVVDVVNRRRDVEAVGHSASMNSRRRKDTIVYSDSVPGAWNAHGPELDMMQSE